MARPERGQIPFLFEARRDPSQTYYELGFIGQEKREGPGRFVRRLNEEVSIRTPLDAATHLAQHVFTPFEAFDQEELWSLLLDSKNHITHETMIYRGTINSIHIRQAELFKEAIRVNAPAILIAHNHPSGDPEPSREDVLVTEETVAACRILGVELLDHIICGRNSWVSLKEKNLGFP